MVELAEATKRCPRCAEDIRAEALMCRYCRQEFAVRHVGYCTTCHARVDVGGGTACLTCGSAVMDITLESEAVAESAIPAPPIPDARAMAAPATGPAPSPAPVAPAAPAIIGTLRTGFVPTLAHQLALSFHALAAIGLVLLFLAQFAFDAAVRAIRVTGFREDKLVLGGIPAVVMPIVCVVILATLRVGPKGRRWTATHAEFRDQLKEWFGARELWRPRLFRLRAAIAAVVWAAGLVLTELARPAGWSGVGATIQPGYYIGIGLVCLGALCALALAALPQTTVQIDDEGHLVTT